MDVTLMLFLLACIIELTNGAHVPIVRKGDPSNCHTPLGVQSPEQVLASRIKRTSGAGEGRLLGADAWVTPFGKGLNESITVDLGHGYIISGIETQGDPQARRWVTLLSVEYSQDCHRFTIIKSSTGSRKVFTANVDQDTAVTTIFSDIIQARCIKFVPISTRYNRTIALRVEVLGCDEGECRVMPIGVASASIIPDNHFLSSDQGVSPNYAPHRARLTSNTGWIPRNNSNSWLIIKFPSEKIISEMKVGGEVRGHRYVRSFTFQISRNCIRYFTLMEEGSTREKIFTTDSTSGDGISVIRLPSPVRASCVKIVPRTYPDQGVAVRVEFTGCGTGGGILGSCGVRKHKEKHFKGVREKRVVGGIPTEQGEWPWLISLMWQGIGHKCGGSLIHPQWVLTAAHCVLRNDTKSGHEMVRPSMWTARVGEHNFELEQRLYADFEVERIIPHPQFSWKTLFNDLCLFKLNRSVEMSDYVNTICLPGEEETVVAGEECQVGGWGYMTYMYGDYTDISNHVDVTVVDTQQCDILYEESFQSHLNITEEKMLCAHGTDGGKDSCQGDSGGPLICQKGEKWVQFGVTSFGQGCGDKKFPGVYTNVRKHMEWIDAEIVANIRD
ncbi:uncharacterized protein LOC135488147 [Lineus longissimus]|uniref:uncharacterized protein LOC135488147 n=1 Tax=Lineus longissimus TaxID=88925 RepID=UPI00315D46B2